MPKPQHGSARRLVVLLTAVVAAGIPLFAYLWETLNQLLAGHVNLKRLAVSAPLLLLFLALLAGAGRGFTRLTAPAPSEAPSDAEPVIAGTLFLTALLIMFVFGAWIVIYDLLLNR